MSLFPKDRDLTRAPEKVELRVDASDLRLPLKDVNIRLDNFLARHLKWRSRSSIKTLIRDGYVLVAASAPDRPQGGELERELRSGRRLRHGSRVVVVIPEELRFQLPAQEAAEPLTILYEDEHVLAVDKPPMQVVHPSGRHFGGTLIQQVHACYREEGLAQGRVPRLCHRLDRETSGIVLISKNPRTHPELMRQFEEREVEKRYLAIVEGSPGQDRGRIEHPLGPARTSSVGLKMAALADGLPSRTDWSVVERRADCALLACELFTGRQHQIRVHLAAIGHPIVGDKLYGPSEDYFQRNVDGELSAADLAALKHARHALHNHRLVFVSPAHGERVEVVSPLAQDLVEYLVEHSGEC